MAAEGSRRDRERGEASQPNSDPVERSLHLAPREVKRGGDPPRGPVVVGVKVQIGNLAVVLAQLRQELVQQLACLVLEHAVLGAVRRGDHLGQGGCVPKRGRLRYVQRVVAEPLVHESRELLDARKAALQRVEGDVAVGVLELGPRDRRKVTQLRGDDHRPHPIELERDFVWRQLRPRHAHPESTPTCAGQLARAAPRALANLRQKAAINWLSEPAADLRQNSASIQPPHDRGRACQSWRSGCYYRNLDN